MILAIAGLWLMWWRNSKRQRLVESMLRDSAKQLNEASGHLQQALKHINQLTDGTASFRHENDDRHTEKAPSSEEDTHTRILGMQREGKTAEEMAKELNLPLNQIRLILKLHANRENYS